jgi:hypothetical protein
MSGYEAAELIALAAPDVAAILMVAEGRAEQPEVTLGRSDPALAP